MAVDLATWRADAPAITRAVFEPGGILSRVIPDYHAQPAQARMAAKCAATVVSGLDARLVSFHQASTGIGKGLAYGVPCAVHAVLTRKPVVVATHTISLQRQWTTKDGRIVAEVVERLTGLRPSVALRRSQRSFVDPNEATAYARMLVAQAAQAGDEDAAALTLRAAALERLAAYARDVGALAALQGAAVVDSLDGLVETYAETAPEDWDLLKSLPADAYCVHPHSEVDSLVLYNLYAERSKMANVLVTTHAAAVIDLKLGGIISPVGRDVGCVVFDEAEHLPEVAKSVIAARHSIGALNRDVAETLRTAAGDGLEAPARTRIADAAVSLMADVDALVDHLRTRAAEMGDRSELRVEIVDSVVALLMSISGGVDALMSVIEAEDCPLFVEVVRDLKQQAYHIEAFLDEVGLAPADRLSHPTISFSPVRQRPALMLVPKSHKMLISRLWAGKRPRADSIIFTSATLAAPGVDDEAAFNDMIEQVGLAKRRELVSLERSGVYEPENFGAMSFRLAHPDAPIPGRIVDDTGATPAVAYAVAAILAAASSPSARGTANVLVLTKSFDAAATIGAALSVVLGDRLVVRGRAASLDDVVQLFLGAPNRVLVTPGAWEGLDIPNWIDHVVIPRLPYDPPKGSEWRVPTDDGEGMPRAVLNMLRRLKQGMGRGIRKAGDVVCVWICDPRFGMPADLAAAHMLPQHPKSKPVFFAVVERRFRAALTAAEIIPLPESLTGPGHAALEVA